MGENNIKNNFLLLRDYNNQKVVRNIKNGLTLDYEEILGFKPKFEQFGSYEEGGYTIYFIQNGFHFHVEFAYESRQDVLIGEDMRSSLTDDELGQELDMRRDMNFLVIHALSVQPKGKGLGTKLITKLFDWISKVGKPKATYLTATDSNAIKFWRKMGFVEFEQFNDNYEIPESMLQHTMLRYMK